MLNLYEIYIFIFPSYLIKNKEHSKYFLNYKVNFNMAVKPGRTLHSDQSVSILKSPEKWKKTIWFLYENISVINVSGSPQPLRYYTVIFSLYRVNIKNQMK